MKHLIKMCTFFALFTSFNPLYSLEPSEHWAILEVIKGYSDAWNEHECRGFANGFTEDADFVNLFGMHFSGKDEIEKRHVQIMQTFLKGSKLEIISTKLREVYPGLVVALVHWKLTGHSDARFENPLDIREGLFTQIFINTHNKWEITASQNTLIPKL